MKVLRITLIAVALMFGVGVAPTMAQTYRINDRMVGSLLNRIDKRTDDLKFEINRAFDNDRSNGTRGGKYVNEIVSDFERSVDRMRQNYGSSYNIAGDVREVLRRANAVENIFGDYRFDVRVTNTWTFLKSDLERLARYYNVSWNRTDFPVSNRLNGTYRLNIYESDEVDSTIDRSLGYEPDDRRGGQRDNLRRRLNVPELLAIERSGNLVLIASSNAPRMTFEANGRPTTETLPNGRQLTSTVTLYGDKLAINSDGDRINAFYVSFEPIRNGEKMRVTRRLNLENQNRTITVVSVYDRTSNVAKWDVYRNGNVNNGNTYGGFYIPNGTRLTAVLRTDLSTKETVEGDRFEMVVNEPFSYRGAIIEGTVGKVERSGRLTGSAKMDLNFETIRLRNGQSYRFEGLIDRITTEDGKNIKIDNESGVKGSSQTKDTVLRTGVGAGIGAIIGGLLGGGKGAAVGAVIGAGAGGGSVVLQGRDDLKLDYGTMFELTSSAPSNIAYRN